ncbi:MAG: hypothetical protein KDB14_17890 [Planctomycetales bacterium]|nr:hypothetical protein [Planctomycetales bacterium]
MARAHRESQLRRSEVPTAVAGIPPAFYGPAPGHSAVAVGGATLLPTPPQLPVQRWAGAPVNGQARVSTGPTSAAAPGGPGVPWAAYGVKQGLPSMPAYVPTESSMAFPSASFLAPLPQRLPSGGAAVNTNANPSINGPPPTQQPASPGGPIGRGPEQFLHRETYHADEIPYHRPWVGSDTTLVPFDPSRFKSDPNYDHLPYDAGSEIGVFTGKHANRTQQPWVNGFRGLYRDGPIPVSPTWLGETNLIAPHFLVYGDCRLGAAYIQQNARDLVNIATKLNLDVDFKLTATERFHAFVTPLNDGGSVTRIEVQDGEARFIDEFDPNFDTIFFEGDIGSLWGGLTGQDSPFDLPIAMGIYPWLAQNGVWFNDAVLGVATTIPARNNAALNWSNYDLSFFAVFDELTSPAFGGGNDVHAYGGALFLEAYDGYVESGYAYLNNLDVPELSYHNATLAYTRRIRALMSTSLRVLLNEGQRGPVRTADGQLFLWENSLITRYPSTVVPYCNLFAGFGRPQSVARAAGAGGVLANTGIVFETDGLNNTPTLDATAANTFGGAVGINLLDNTLTQQLVFEFGAVQIQGRSAARNAAGNQYGFGARYQKVLNHAWILRFDALYGFLDQASDIAAIRSELRWKF